MNDRYDAIVIGLGAMGSAASYHLAAVDSACSGWRRSRPATTRDRHMATTG
jgi:3-hydroxyisobutyrate dehydrogenase-like beta-hydroxyacid dehydrogenase